VAADAEAILRGSRAPLVLGIGGGGDVVGALATAEAMRLYDDADPVIGGLTWERRPIDPVPGPRSAGEIEGAWELAPGVLLAGPHARVAGRGVRFGEAGMARLLGRPTVLVDIGVGPATVARSLAAALRALRCDLAVFVDVGGDVLAHGDEPGLRSPLCDAVMLAAAGLMASAGQPVLLGVFGAGCDSELTAEEVLGRISSVAAAGGLCGARGLTEPVVERLERSLSLVPTEASAQAVSAFRGACGEVTIRGGERTFALTSLAVVTFFLDVPATVASVGRLARAVAAAGDVEDANEALHRLGVRTELDLERDAAR